MNAGEKYRPFDHTADLGLEIYGRDKKELFANACFALFDHIVEPAGLTGSQQIEITVSGLDMPDLMFNWLRELLVMWTVQGRLISSARILDLSDTRLRARLSCDPFLPGRQQLKADVKAVTCHDLTVTQTAPGGWLARVVFDV